MWTEVGGWGGQNVLEYEQSIADVYLVKDVT